MSHTPIVRVDCPRCESTVRAPLPRPRAGPTPTGELADRLRGTERDCSTCDTELDVYYYASSSESVNADRRRHSPSESPGTDRVGRSGSVRSDPFEPDGLTSETRNFVPQSSD